jgi:hypothetical protein
MVCQFELRIKKIAFFLIKRVESVGTNKHQSALTIIINLYNNVLNQMYSS